jgi:hypothetical protein
MAVCRKIFVLIILLFSIEAMAGIKGFTWHSRANCGNNESISWQLGKSRWLATWSEHYLNGKLQHTASSSLEYTWRSAAVHWFEAKPGAGWSVYGIHYITESTGRILWRRDTDVTDCSIYDGWWDHDFSGSVAIDGGAV